MSDTVDLETRNGDGTITFDPADLLTAAEHVNPAAETPIIVGDIVAIGDGYDDGDFYLYKKAAEGKVFVNNSMDIESIVERQTGDAFEDYLVENVDLSVNNDFDTDYDALLADADIKVSYGHFNPGEIRRVVNDDGATLTKVRAENGEAMLGIRDDRE